jgi:putative heme-binding domain-containing protein
MIARMMCRAVLLCMACALAHAQSLPDGKGKAEFQRVCSGCHGVNMATSQRMDKAQWTSVVNDMVSRGAQGSQQDFDSIIGYLSANFAKDTPATATQPAPAAPSAPAMPALSEAEVAKANGIIRANGCLSCHRVAGAGAYTGPDLSDVGTRHTSDEIRTALVAPAKDVHPENRSVRLVTGDGTTVTGRILNQDGFSVQLIDTGSQLRSFQKAGLREFTILTANPMPSFADKISGDDLIVLVHYLSSLNGTGAQ